MAQWEINNSIIVHNKTRDIPRVSSAYLYSRMETWHFLNLSATSAVPNLTLFIKETERFLYIMNVTAVFVTKWQIVK